MRDRQFSQDGALFGSSHCKPSALPLPTDNDAGLLALEAQFDSLVAELVAPQKQATPQAVQTARHPPETMSKLVQSPIQIRATGRKEPRQSWLISTPSNERL
jgi:hypothetical protein